MQNQTININVGNGNMSADSYFDGGLLQMIGWTLLGMLVTVLTLGICLPWAYCMIYRWEAKHTVTMVIDCTLTETLYNSLANGFYGYCLRLLPLVSTVYGLE